MPCSKKRSISSHQTVKNATATPVLNESSGHKQAHTAHEHHVSDHAGATLNGMMLNSGKPLTRDICISPSQRNC